MTKSPTVRKRTLRRVFLGLPFLAVGSLIAASRPGHAALSDVPPFYVTLPKPLPAVAFHDAAGRTHSLADFKGKFVLLNVWATWCAPCRKEMPALDRLQEKLGGSRFQVVPVSIDIGGLAAVRKFYRQVGIKRLGIYLDPKGDIMQSLGLEGLPTSFLINPDGKQIGRVMGAAKWDSPHVLQFLRSTINGSSTPT